MVAIAVAAAAAVVSVAGIEPDTTMDAGARAMPLAELPARPLPDRVASDLSLDLAVAHAAIVITRKIVGAYVRETEPMVTVEFETRFGRAKVAAVLAPRVFAEADRRLRLGREN